MNTKTVNYDYVIIGGGITGMYAVEKLIDKYGKSKSIALFDDRSYYGGRLLTHHNPKYEIGGARFHDGHTLLCGLIQKYNVEKVSLHKEVDFLYSRSGKVKFFKDAHITFEHIMKDIITFSKKMDTKVLQSMTLKQLIDKISKGYVLSNKLLHIFGYYSEICEMNAYDALRSIESDFMGNTYYTLTKGFSNLLKKMYQRHKSHVYFNLNCSVKQVTQTKTSNSSLFLCDIEHVKSNRSFNIQGRNVIFAIKAKQIRPFNVLKPIKKYIQDIYSAPLLRIYAQYPKNKTGKVWFDTINRVTTNSILRHIIPIDTNNGLIMISYTDGEDINPFYQNKRQKLLKSDSEIKSMIKHELSILYPSCTIPEPYYFKCHLWHVGAHHWRPNVDSSKVSKIIQNPSKGVYVVGEAFSTKQAWIEGGLQGVENIIHKL